MAMQATGGQLLASCFYEWRISEILIDNLPEGEKTLLKKYPEDITNSVFCEFEASKPEKKGDSLILKVTIDVKEKFTDNECRVNFGLLDRHNMPYKMFSCETEKINSNGKVSYVVEKVLSNAEWQELVEKKETVLHQPNDVLKVLCSIVFDRKHTDESEETKTES